MTPYIVIYCYFFLLDLSFLQTRTSSPLSYSLCLTQCLTYNSTHKKASLGFFLNSLFQSPYLHFSLYHVHERPSKPTRCPPLSPGTSAATRTQVFPTLILAFSAFSWVGSGYWAGLGIHINLNTVLGGRLVENGTWSTQLKRGFRDGAQKWWCCTWNFFVCLEKIMHDFCRKFGNHK